MSNTEIRWYQVPEVWLMIIMLLATMAGSLGLVATAYEHPDVALHAPPALAAPLPPSSAHAHDPHARLP